MIAVTKIRELEQTEDLLERSTIAGPEWTKIEKRRRAILKECRRLILEGTERPVCRYCGKKLPWTRYMKARDIREGTVFGGYGDGHFCGLDCGYRYGKAIASALAKKEQERQGKT